MPHKTLIVEVEEGAEKTLTEASWIIINLRHHQKTWMKDGYYSKKNIEYSPEADVFIEKHIKIEE